MQVPSFDKWPVPAQVRVLLDVRNMLNDEEHTIVLKEREHIAAELKLWLPDREKAIIRGTKRENLASLCSFMSPVGNLGMAIRNEYELWLPEHHVTKIWHDAERRVPLAMCEIPGRILCDEHPCHPDNFSFSCIERLWEILQ